MGDVIRIERKVKEHGWNALDRDEWDCLDAAESLMGRLGFREVYPDLVEGFQMWKDMPPEEREKFREWTPTEVYTWKQLIDERRERGTLGD